MDVRFFLRERTRFIRQFYDDAVAPFEETMRKIEEGEPPYEPPYSEDGGEPPYLAQWLDAGMALEVLGRTCVSLLSDSVKLLLQTWEKQLGVECSKHFKDEFKEGFIAGYRHCFQQCSGQDWKESGVDLNVLEQIILARNDSQHPTEIFTMDVSHRNSLKKYKDQLFFEKKFGAMKGPEYDGSLWANTNLHVAKESLYSAIQHVEMLADWLEERLYKILWG